MAANGFFPPAVVVVVLAGMSLQGCLAPYYAPAHEQTFLLPRANKPSSGQTLYNKATVCLDIDHAPPGLHFCIDPPRTSIYEPGLLNAVRNTCPKAEDGARRRWKISFDVTVIDDSTQAVDTTRVVAALQGPDGVSEAEDASPSRAQGVQFLHFNFDKPCALSATYRLAIGGLTLHGRSLTVPAVDYLATTRTVPGHAGFIGES